MANFNYVLNHDKIYNLGFNIGYFAAFLLFASAFYFIMGFFHKIPQAVKYYHVLSFVIIAYLIGLAALKLRK